jgi:hypothetical protein
MPCNAVIRRTWNIVDVCGNRLVCIQNITVRDNVPPVIICPPSRSYTCVRDTATSISGVATATDNCGGTVSLSYSDAITGNLTCEGSVRRTWTARDACGNSTSCTQIIAVLDNVPPVITCPPSRTVTCIRDTATSITGIATATDNCGTPLISYNSTSSSSLPCNGTVDRRWAARDLCGNVSSCVQLITVRDSVKPTITCPASLTVTASQPTCRVAVSAIKWLTATDNCGSTPSVNYTISGATTAASSPNDASGQIFNSGISTVTYTALDNCGNTQTCNFTVTVKCDSVACPCPNNAIAGPNLVVNGNFSAGNTGFTSDYTYYAPATSPSIAGGYTVCDSISAYVTNPYWYCTDHTTGSASGLFLVCDGSSSATAAAWRQTFTTTVGRTYNFCFFAKNLIRPNSGFTNPSIEVWIKEGAAAFMKKTTLPIVLPETPNNWMPYGFSWVAGASPVVIEIRSVVSGSGTDFAIDDISLTTCGEQQEPCKASFTYSALNSCGNFQFTSTSTPTTGLSYAWNFGDGTTSTTQNPIKQFTSCGTYNVCLLITGPNCRDSICQTVRFNNSIPPVLVGVPTNVTVQCSAIPSLASVTATDNCSPSVSPVFNEVRTNGACPNAFTLTRTWTATDNCGNTARANQVITVIDNTPPVVVCPTNRTVACVRDTTPSVTGSATATDNCDSSPTVSYTSVTSGSLPCNGTIQRTWTARDACSNTSTCVQLITVRDSVKPTITCPTSLTVTASQPTCRVAVPAIKWLTATDNCGNTPSVNYTISGATTTASSPNDASGQIFNSGISTVTYTVLDNCGNTQTCNFTVTVKCDSICPCPNNMVAGTNLVVNGDFSAGNTGFSSDYIYHAPGTGSISRAYTVSDSISAYTSNNYWYCTGHTTGTPSDLFLVCDGSSNATDATWRQTFPTIVGRTYKFCFFANNLIRPGTGSVNPLIEVWVKEGTGAFAKRVGPITLFETPNIWQSIGFDWLSTASPVVIEIRSVVNLDAYNDYAIDDISLTTCSAPNGIKSITNELVSISIVPNPNQGNFMVNLPKMPQMGTKLRVVNALGQLVQEFNTQLNSEQQTIQLPPNVTDGLYFLQVILEGKVIGVEKFVKQ